MNTIAHSRQNGSVVALIGANLIAIVLAIVEGWDLHELMLIYWAQSVIIGYFSVRRMLELTEFSTDGVSQNGRHLDATPATQKSMAGFFTLHYGAFHLVYLVFILADERNAFQGNWLYLLLCATAFFFNHRYSFIEHRQRDASRKPNIGNIMFFPYARIVPMHLTIIAGGAFGGASTGILLLFLGLKTVADVIMHKIEHAAWRK